jgi:hypothetical protein
MERPAPFVVASLVLHGVALGFAVAAGHGPVAPPLVQAPVDAFAPLLLEGATLEATTPREPMGASTETTSRVVTPAPSDDAHARHARPAPAPEGAANGGAGAHRGARYPAMASATPAANTVAPSGSTTAPAASALTPVESVGGGPRTVFGTAVLRAFLLALSANPLAVQGGDRRISLRYAGGDGAAPHVRAEPEDASGLRMARALEALLAQASAGLPALEGTLVIDTSHDERADGVFTITCDDAHRTGSVGFADGRRARVHELR